MAVMKAAPAAAITFTVYGFCSRTLVMEMLKVRVMLHVRGRGKKI